MRCKFFGHTWDNYTVNEKTWLSSFTSIGYDTEYRLCKRCYKKQRSMKFAGLYKEWVDSELTLDEVRDRKLKKLGIANE